MQDDSLERLLTDAGATADATGARASSRLKSRIYSALMRHQAESGPILALPASRAGGRGLCVFEALVSACPTGERVQQANLCRVCHARVLAEQIEGAPIFWPNCPYAGFQKR